MNYYDRSAIQHIDGTHIFQSATDRHNEQEVADLVSQKWNCSIRSFGALSPVDWYAERNSRMIGLAELKSRTHPRTRFPSVFLNVRKWLALTIGSIGLGVPSVFIVRFMDGEILWVPVSKIDATKIIISGLSHHMKSVNDIEPIIEVPVSALRELK